MNKAVSVQAGRPRGSFYPLRTFFSPFFCFGRRTRTRTKSENNSHVAVSQSVSHQYVQTRERERDSFCKEKKVSVVQIYIYILWYICSISLSLSHIHLPPQFPLPFFSSSPSNPRNPTPRKPPHKKLPPLIQHQNTHSIRHGEKPILGRNNCRLKYMMEFRHIEEENCENESESNGGE